LVTGFIKFVFYRDGKETLFSKDESFGMNVFYNHVRHVKLKPISKSCNVFIVPW
jgi:hypothetical protein